MNDIFPFILGHSSLNFENLHFALSSALVCVLQILFALVNELQISLIVIQSCWISLVHKKLPFITIEYQSVPIVIYSIVHFLHNWEFYLLTEWDDIEWSRDFFILIPF
jgi:hypothetical protein